MGNKIIGTIVLAVAVGITGCNSYDANRKASGTEKPKMTDSELESKIKARIESDADLKAAGISVDANADRNEATISGTVATQALRTRAVELAKSANPSLILTDKIDVKPREITRSEYTDQMARDTRERAKGSGDTIGSTLDDAWIHTKISTKLIGDSETPRRKINIDVVNNVVTLRGTVDTPAQRAEAERIAKETEGVKSVKNLLKVAKSAT